MLKLGVTAVGTRGVVCAVRPHNQRLKRVCVPCAAAADDRNAQQLDQLLAGLAQLREQQRLGQAPEADGDELEEDEFPAETEGIDWVWWRSQDVAAAADGAQQASTPPVGVGDASPSSGSPAQPPGAGVEVQAQQLKQQPQQQQTAQQQRQQQQQQRQSTAQQQPTSGASTGNPPKRVRRRVTGQQQQQQK